MSAALDKLVSIASAKVARPPLTHEYGDLGAGELGNELLALLAKKNGFYAFASALHVFPLGAHTDSMNLEAWNALALWRDHYEELAEGYLFFAEDVFGNQFGIEDGTVWSFEAETGTPKATATTLTDWAEAVLSDYNYWTGYPPRAPVADTTRPLAAWHETCPKDSFCGRWNLHARKSVPC